MKVIYTYNDHDYLLSDGSRRVGTSTVYATTLESLLLNAEGVLDDADYVHGRPASKHEIGELLGSLDRALRVTHAIRRRIRHDYGEEGEKAEEKMLARMGWV